MTELLNHQHLIIRATLHKPPHDVNYITQWIKELVEAIDMKILIEPQAVYSDMIGNRGLTAIAVIETSHIALHCWDEVDPAILEFDLYSCKTVDVQQVLTFLDEFEPMEISYMFLDRNFDLVPIETGKRTRPKR